MITTLFSSLSLNIKRLEYFECVQMFIRHCLIAYWLPVLSPGQRFRWILCSFFTSFEISVTTTALSLTSTSIEIEISQTRVFLCNHTFNILWIFDLFWRILFSKRGILSVNFSTLQSMWCHIWLDIWVLVVWSYLKCKTFKMTVFPFVQLLHNIPKSRVLDKEVSQGKVGTICLIAN